MSPRDYCKQKVSVCPDDKDAPWLQFIRNRDDINTSAPNIVVDGGTLDIRVTKGYGARGYDKIRLSAISSAPVESESFTYQEQFRYRWTDNVLSSGVVDIVPGESNQYTIDGKVIDLHIPLENEGVRGVIIADPCFQSRWVKCKYEARYRTFERTTSLLNAIFDGHDDTAYWSVIGDNFYDQTGLPTMAFFNALSLSVKSALMLTFPGNHDFWVSSSPEKWTQADQLGNGFMVRSNF